MPARVILVAVEGTLKGQRVVFERRTACRVGRARDCTLRFPSEPSLIVSRHHCLLDIDPPYIGICDCGSRNGTYVNGVKIGQRGREASPEEPEDRPLAEHTLRAGDEVRIGDTIFRVVIQSAVEPPDNLETSSDAVAADRETVAS